MLIETYQTIIRPSSGTYKEKGSRFLAFAHPVDSEELAKNLIEQYRKQYHDARHVCFAYKILKNSSEISRSNDDGEPSGTAGRPILGQITSFNVSNIILIVVRYFGGIKLGTSGLTSAYKNVAFDALNTASIVVKKICISYRVSVPYSQLSIIQKIIHQSDGKILTQKFDAETCVLLFEIGINQKDLIEARFPHNLQPHIIS